MNPRRPDGRPLLLCLDKPAGPTSFDMVRRVRRMTGYRKVGHGGTLDPFATGLLMLGLGPATRLLGFLGRGRKVYRLGIRFGIGTDSHDSSGAVVDEAAVQFDPDELRRALPGFVGRIEQTPPRLSAVKVGGVRAYRRHRRGERDVEPAPRTVTIHRIELLEICLPRAEMRVECEGGTYMRSLARDLGGRLGCPAHADALRREAVGPFHLDEAVTPEQLEATWPAGPGILDAGAIARDWPRLRLDAADVAQLRQGTQPRPEWIRDAGWDTAPDLVALEDPRGRLVAVARREGPATLRLAMVLPEMADADL